MINPNLNKPPRNVILYGGTGQAKVVRPILEHWGARVVAVFDDTPDLPSPFPDVPIHRGWSALLEWAETVDRTEHGFVVTIGNPHGNVRLRLHDQLTALGMQPVTIAHPAAFIEANARIGDGTQVMAGAVVGAEAIVGRQCIINTNATVDHESVLEDGVEIAPGATLCGLVRVGTAGWVCAGATVLPRIRIGSNAIVGAGAVVIRHVADGILVVGVPAKRVLTS
jgi:sugar O-acyltransferase (sialic acid O-acetyltransferase NeuD family)